ncbi:alpha/beta fold hydrolase [Kribbella sandramycini]|uniref:Pimeloyl-ACP methyl ester carboxylesterase n=1 Tax=Kribbella sandramycini TaxID=60450 RepID=A0A841SDR4_9ACTN|nr:alpha/beta hydrolase [Kribbella sandramycini]MBB6569409.1 pimeloyl-ACP methyl ester carboxylesterase [Kribbella sandramycini]
MTTEQLYHQVNGVELCAQTFGDPADPPVLLIHGASASMLWWDESLCEALAARGRYVIRYDQRDTGRSTTCLPGEPNYAMSDLAADAVALLDALAIPRAHVVAQSMNGGTGLQIAVDHASRVLSITFVATTTGDDALPPPSADLPRFDPPDFTDPAAVEEYVVQATAAEVPGMFDEQAMRSLVRRDMARARNYESSLTNHYAMVFDGPRAGSFDSIKAPALIIHGESDPIFPLPHGEALRDAIPNARLVTLPKPATAYPPRSGASSSTQ